MLLTNRLFERQPPNREAKSIYIFCEGAKREYQYFRYFRELDSRVNVEVYRLHPHDDNSPRGLLDIAKKCIIQTKENPMPKYKFQKNDEVWIVIDVDKDHTDSRKPQVEKLRNFCKEKDDWEVLQSNPCFEVWLHYHKFKKRQVFNGDDNCTYWKDFVNNAFSGGFDSRRHPIFIQKAIKHSKINFQSKNFEPNIGCTEVFKLGESMMSILKEKIEKVLAEIEE